MAKEIFTGEPPEATARYLASKGKAGVEQMQQIVNRARKMVTEADMVFDHPMLLAVPRYTSDTEVAPTPGGRSSVWIASTDDYASDEGLSIYFIVAFASSESEFRRSIAHELGSELADRASVRAGAGLSLPFANLFLSPSFRSTLAAFERGEQRPIMMNFVAGYRAKYF